jgi:hypothetical protein
MQQHQQRDRRSSHAEENAGKQQKEVRVSRGPAGAVAAVLAQDRDIRNQVEAEQGVKQKAKPKAKQNMTQKQIQMQAVWLPRVEHAGSRGPRTCSRGLEINYLDDHRTDPAEERRR